MIHISALFADTSWRALASQGATLVVEGVFRYTLNLRDEKTGILYSLFLARGYNAPRAMNINLDSEVLFERGQIGHVTNNSLSLPTAEISLDKCQFKDNFLSQIKNPKPDNVLLVEERTKNNALQGSFYGPIDGDLFNEALVNKLILARQQFIERIDELSVKGLLGLGVGLTPSGDDYLLGYMAVSPIKIRNQLASFISDNLVKTTQVSRLYLEEAIDGKFAEPIRNLCQAISSSDATLVESATTELLAHGATSGQDIITGMCDAWNKNNKERI